PTPGEPAVVTELRALVNRAQAGDPAALPRIRQTLDQHPEVWQHLGDLSALAERAWIGVLAADNPLGVEAMKRTVEEMRAELAGEHPTRLERMIVDQIIVCWMEVQYLEVVAAEAGRRSFEQTGPRLRRLDSAQKRYLKAVKALAELRTLLPSTPAPAGPIR